MKRNRIRWTGHVALISELRNSYQNLVRKEKRDLHEYRMIILKWILKKQYVEVIDWVELAKNRI
jgi:hypothetical protein